MIDIQEHYQPPVATWWAGRSDGGGALRYHETIKPLNILEEAPLANGKAAAIIGFACDEGVRRNQGRPGAEQGPAAFRAAFGSLPDHTGTSAALYDAGDIVCKNGDLEGAQEALADLVDVLVKQGFTPIVIGGGHELAWGEFLGLTMANPTLSRSIVNFDAHYDLRPLPPKGKGSSGTPFRQIAEHCKQNGTRFDYTCLGIQRLGNTTALHAEADELGVHTVYAEEMVASSEAANSAITMLLARNRPIYLSICLDVFTASAAPGVSAPQPFGIDPWLIMPHLNHLTGSGRIEAVGIAELSPPFDQDSRTARLTAHIVSSIVEKLL